MTTTALAAGLVLTEVRAHDAWDHRSADHADARSHGADRNGRSDRAAPVRPVDGVVELRLSELKAGTYTLVVRDDADLDRTSARARSRATSADESFERPRDAATWRNRAPTVEVRIPDDADLRRPARASARPVATMRTNTLADDARVAPSVAPSEGRAASRTRPLFDDDDTPPKPVVRIRRTDRDDTADERQRRQFAVIKRSRLVQLHSGTATRDEDDSAQDKLPQVRMMAPLASVRTDDVELARDWNAPKVDADQAERRRVVRPAFSVRAPERENERSRPRALARADALEPVQPFGRFRFESEPDDDSAARPAPSFDDFEDREPDVEASARRKAPAIVDLAPRSRPSSPAFDDADDVEIAELRSQTTRSRITRRQASTDDARRTAPLREPAPRLSVRVPQDLRERADEAPAFDDTEPFASTFARSDTDRPKRGERVARAEPRPVEPFFEDVEDLASLGGQRRAPVPNVAAKEDLFVGERDAASAARPASPRVASRSVLDDGDDFAPVGPAPKPERGFAERPKDDVTNELRDEPRIAFNDASRAYDDLFKPDGSFALDDAAERNARAAPPRSLFEPETTGDRTRSTARRSAPVREAKRNPERAPSFQPEASDRDTARNSTPAPESFDTAARAPIERADDFTSDPVGVAAAIRRNRARFGDGTADEADYFKIQGRYAWYKPVAPDASRPTPRPRFNEDRDTPRTPRDDDSLSRGTQGGFDSDGFDVEEERDTGAVIELKGRDIPKPDPFDSAAIRPLNPAPDAPIADRSRRAASSSVAPQFGPPVATPSVRDQDRTFARRDTTRDSFFQGDDFDGSDAEADTPPGRTAALSTEPAGRVTPQFDRLDPVRAGYPFKAGWSGTLNRRGWIAVARPTARLGEHYSLRSAKRGLDALSFRAPSKPGRYELRFLSPDRRVILARQGFEVKAAKVRLVALEFVDPSDKLNVWWAGPGDRSDSLTLARVGARDSGYLTRQLVGTGNPLTIKAPKQPGTYEMRYVNGSDNRVMYRRKLVVAASPPKLLGP